MDDLVKIYWCVNPIRIGKERKLDIMNDKMDLFGIFKKDIGYRAFMAVDEPLDGLLFFILPDVNRSKSMERRCPR